MGRLLAPMLVFLAGCLLLPPPAIGQVLSDDFDDDAVDTSLWTAFSVGSGPTWAETNGRLEIAHPSTAADDPTVHYFMAGYDGVCKLRGDYDIQVSYSLLTWPFGSGVRIGLNTGVMATERDSLGTNDFPGQPRESYVTDASDGVHGFVSTGDLSGALRQVRSGGTVTGYYLSAGSWIPIHSSPAATGDVVFRIVSWSHDYAFTNQNVQIAFDDFVVNQGELIGDPGQCGDADGDGYRPPVDCNNEDPSINPDAVELPGNFVDENCDGDLGACDPCSPWRNHGEYVRCVAHDVDLLVSGGVITEEEGDSLVSSAAGSHIGQSGFVPAECQ